MNATSNRWGVEVAGAEEVQKAWRLLLKPPFEPFVEDVKDERGEYLALRSMAFNDIATPKDVREVAKQLLSTLNVAMATNVDLDPTILGPVIEFVPEGLPRKHHFMEAESAEMRVRIGIVAMTLKDAQGNEIEPPPKPSKIQLWMRAAALDPEIGSALRYLQGKPSWSELYKAFEAVRSTPQVAIPKGEIKRFTQTANVGARHHPNEKFKPHRQPMELWEARALITRLVSAAIDDVLSKDARDRP